MQGILLVDKPEDWTSFDVVAYVRKFVAKIEGKKPRNVKVGHTGTLDPAATGLLVICVGKSTKLVPTLIKKDKVYQVEMTLGSVSTTGDREGEITVISDLKPTETELSDAVQGFVGKIMQTPPIYSAVKVNGTRAYVLARAGKEVIIQPREVDIKRITVEKYQYPKVFFECEVGSGTYIRSLVEDIGQKLSTGAYMSGLRRTKVGEYTISSAVLVSDINEELLNKILDKNVQIL